MAAACVLLLTQVGARYRVALQLHPHEDFAANPPHGALGPTAARWRSLQARGWRVSDWLAGWLAGCTPALGSVCVLACLQ